MTKTLVIGGSGFLGSHLIPRLLEKGHDVTVQDVLSKDEAFKIKDYIPKIKYQWKSVFDINSKDIEGFDNVAFLAAVTDVPLAMNSPHWTIYQNVDAVVSYLEALKKVDKAPRTLYMSTESVYGKIPYEHLPATEDESFRPANIYGVSKCAAELMIRAYKNQFDFPIVIFRSTSLFGERCRSSQVIPIFIRQALKNEPLTMEGDGSQTRDWNYVGNMANAIAEVLNNNIGDGVYNIGTGTDMSLKEVAEKILLMTGSKSEIVYKPWRAGEQGIKLSVSIEKAKRELNYKPIYTFDEGLLRTCNYIVSTKSVQLHYFNVPVAMTNTVQ
jgi:UDP-glucose 4-epimerase